MIQAQGAAGVARLGPLGGGAQGEVQPVVADLDADVVELGRAVDGRLILCEIEDRVQLVLQLPGILSIFETADSCEEALKELSDGE